jgi:hypothetical protein
VTKHYKENKKIEHHNNRHVAAAIKEINQMALGQGQQYVCGMKTLF